MAKTLRNTAFCVFMIAAFQARLLASYDELGDFWNNWEGQYECDVSFDDFGTWSASGSCDFSEEADPLGLGNEFCAGHFDSCATACESTAFLEFLVSDNCPIFDENDPACYEECWIGWASNNECSSISETEPIDASCTCGRFNWCD